MKEFECEKCENKTICKWVSERRRIEKVINDVSVDSDDDSPIVVYANCVKFSGVKR